MMTQLKNQTSAVALAMGIAMISGGAAMACAPNYTVQAGDTLFTIAEANLGDMTRWSVIFYNNPQLAGGSITDIPAGTQVVIPCPEGSVVAPAPEVVADPTPLKVDNAELTLVTGAGNAPFADPSLPGQGLLPELINAVMEVTPRPVTYSISWEQDWTTRLDQTATDAHFDMGFPKFKPDCDTTPDATLCTNYHFSEPVVDLVNLLFVKTDGGVRYDNEADMHGRTLCRPAGKFTHDLDHPERRWLVDGKVDLVQPDSVKACFDLLTSGRVDAVAVNEFEGVAAMYRQGLADQVTPLPRPVSVEGLHVVISKKHWRGTTHLFRFNAGLAELKASDRYEEIVARHLTLFLDQLQN